MIVSASAWPGFAAVDAVAERLRTLETLVDVLNVYDVARVDAPKPPSAVVAPLTERALSSPSVPGMALVPQTVEMRIGVIVIVEAANDRSGRRTRAKKTLADLLGQTRQKLLGWVPAPEPEIHGVTGPLAFVAGRLTEIENGRIIWQDEWTCQYRTSRECN